MKPNPIKVNHTRIKRARGGRRAAEVARFLGITYQQLWNIENGKRQPSLDVLVRLSGLYDVPIDRFLMKSPNFSESMG
jgi:transcriptional regulator with XRE-family HTH domain